MSNRTLSAAAIGFCSGICLFSLRNLGITFGLLLVFLSAGLFLFQKYSVSGREKGAIALFAVFLFSCGAGAVRFAFADARAASPVLEAVAGSNISAEGFIIEEPERSDTRETAIVRLVKVVSGASPAPVSSDILVSADAGIPLRYGDEVALSGKLERPEAFADAETGKIFDYPSYLAKDGIFYEMSFAKISVESSGHGSAIRRALFGIKDAFLAEVGKAIPAPESGLLAGILVGEKGGIPDDLSRDFQVAGLSPIVVLSGYNVTVVAEAIGGALSFLPRIAGLFFGGIGIVLFVILAGGSSTAVRAAVMALIAILGKATGRAYDAGRALFAAALLMILWNPKILVFDLSFQLSFLATFAVIYVSPIFEKKLAILPEKFALRQTVAMTLAAQLLVLPLILLDIGLMSFVAVFANALVLPAVPAAMLFGFLAGLAAFVSPLLALPFSWAAWLLLAYIVVLAKFFASLPFSSATISWFGPFLAFCSYVLIGLWIWFERKKGRGAAK